MQRSLMRTGSAWLLIATLGAAFAGACGDDPAASEVDTPDVAVVEDAGPDARPDLPTPWIFEDDALDTTPELTPEAVSAALSAGIDAALELDPEIVKDLHDRLFPPPAPGTGDATGCPFILTYSAPHAESFYWQGECTAPDGTMYSGYGYVSRYDDMPVDFGDLDGYEYFLAGRIEASDGTWLEAAGSATAYDGSGAELDGFARSLDGTFLAGGPGAPSSPWLDGSRRPSLTVSGWVYRPTGGKNLTFSGGLGGVTGFPSGVSAIALDALTVRTKTAGAACQMEPGGGASVRGPDGTWYDVVFDGPTDEEPDATPPALCDGCGATYYRGAAIDDTCIETAPLFAWEGRPW